MVPHRMPGCRRVRSCASGHGRIPSPRAPGPRGRAGINTERLSCDDSAHLRSGRIAPARGTLQMKCNGSPPCQVRSGRCKLMHRLLDRVPAPRPTPRPGQAHRGAVTDAREHSRWTHLRGGEAAPTPCPSRRDHRQRHVIPPGKGDFAVATRHHGPASDGRGDQGTRGATDGRGCRTAPAGGQAGRRAGGQDDRLACPDLIGPALRLGRALARHRHPHQDLTGRHDRTHLVVPGLSPAA